MFNKIKAVLNPYSPVQTHHHAHLNLICEPIKILSVNICHTWPKRNFPVQRMNNFLQVFSEHRFDILLLQEVWRTETTKLNNWLAEHLNMNGVYSRTNGDQKNIGFEEGLSIFSRFPILSTEQKFFRSTMHPFARRQALAARLDTPCGKLWAISVHLSISPWRNRKQVRELTQWVDTLDDDALIGGDFNSPERFSPMKNLKQKWVDTLRFIHPRQKDTYTHRFSLPFGKIIQSRLDYIFLTQKQPMWKVLDSGRIHSHYISDHLAIWAKIALI